MGVEGVQRGAGRALAGMLAVLLCACSTSGRTFDPDSVPFIQRGKWTQLDVRKRFGEPQGVNVRGSGRQVWRYRYSESTSTDTGVLVRIGRFVASLLGRPFFGSPINVRSTTTTFYQLDVEFDAGGVVTDYTYSRDTRPERQVY